VTGKAGLGSVNFWLAELRRRHVFRVAGTYMICAWIVLQIADIVFPPLMVPPWVMTVLTVLVIASLPLVAVLAWIFDITPQGVVRTEPAGEVANRSFQWSGRWIDYVIISALLIILAVVLAQARSSDLPTDRSIAVLPFADLSTDGAQGYFCDGMSEALIDSLSRIPELKVASRTSSFAFRNSTVDVRKVAEQLGVGTILEGSVRKAGGDVRIDVRLVDGRRGYNLWNETYQGTLEDIFSLQDDIARSIVEALEVKLLGNSRLVETATRDQDAYDLYLRGRAKLREAGTLDSFVSAEDYFNQALERDPVFALAMAGLCTTRWWQYEITRDSNHAEKAIAVCKEAHLYDSQAEVQVALGGLYRGTGQYDQASAALERALEMEPRNAEALAARGRLHQVQGRLDQAEADILRAIRLDPEYWRHYSDLGVVYNAMGDHERALQIFSRAIEIEPSSPQPYSNLGGVLLYKGQNLKAADAFRKSIEQAPTARAYSNAGTNYYFAGNYPEAEEMFQAAAGLNPADYRFQGHLADSIRMQDGRQEEALEHYRKAVDLAQERLEINPSDHVARGLLATYLARLGNENAAREELERLSRSEYLGAIEWHGMATAYLFLGETEAAIESFEQAVAEGFPPSRLESDPNLDSLSAHPAFQALIADQAQ